MGGKLLSGIKSMNVNNLTCVRVNWDESECFRIESGVSQGYVISPWLFNVYMDALMRGVKMEMGRMGVRSLVCR